MGGGHTNRGSASPDDPPDDKGIDADTRSGIRQGLDWDDETVIEVEAETRGEEGDVLHALSAAYPAVANYGRFEVLGRLAVGGMAEVFLARETRPHGTFRHVAIKRILPQIADDETFVEMFLDEARLAVRLNHPNICHIYDFGELEESFFISMEFVHGVPLGKMIKRTREAGALPVPIATRIIAHVAEALHYAHQARDGMGRPMNIVHRDVSPQNIMIRFDGVVKLLDFGIAKNATQSSVTEAGVVKGKFSYMSPEQCLGRTIDARTDIFALGACLYEALTGKSLFRRQSDLDTMRAIVHEQPRPLTDLRSDVPEALNDIIFKALEKEPRKRFQTAGDMYVALERLVAERGDFVRAMHLAQYLERLLPGEAAAGPLPGSTPSGRSLALADLSVPNTSAPTANQGGGNRTPAPVPEEQTVDVHISLAEQPPIPPLKSTGYRPPTPGAIASSAKPSAGPLPIAPPPSPPPPPRGPNDTAVLPASSLGTLGEDRAVPSAPPPKGLAADAPPQRGLLDVETFDNDDDAETEQVPAEQIAHVLRESGVNLDWLDDELPTMRVPTEDDEPPTLPALTKEDLPFLHGPEGDIANAETAPLRDAKRKPVVGGAALAADAEEIPVLGEPVTYPPETRRRWILYAIAVLACTVLVGGVGVYLGLYGFSLPADSEALVGASPESGDRANVVELTPEEGSVTSPEAPSPPEAPPETAPPPEAEETPTEEVLAGESLDDEPAPEEEAAQAAEPSSETAMEESAPAEAAPSEEAASESVRNMASTPLSARATGRLEISSSPSGARVRVRSWTGTTPFVIESLPVGPHVVVVQRQGFERWRRTIRIQPGTTASIQAELQRSEASAPAQSGGALGFLTLDTRPASTVYAGGRLVGRTPIRNVPVPSGTLRLRLVDETGETHLRSVRVQEGQPARAFFNL
ncbi:MAG: protein kinase [Myxococcota bacterium]